MNAKAKENNSAKSDKLWTVIKWIDSILCKNLPALSFVKYTYVQIQMGKMVNGTFSSEAVTPQLPPRTRTVSSV